MARGLSSRAKYRAHLPSSTIPQTLFFHSFGAKECTPALVSVSTDTRAKAKVSPLVSAQVPACIAPDQTRFYTNAMKMAERGNSVVLMLKDCGVHQSTLYSCPVTFNNSIVGALIAVDEAPALSPSPTASAASQEKDMLDTMCSMPSLAAR